MPLRATRKRRKLSMTSLIDVIFLLLLFFMLSSTFSRFAEVELQAATAGQTTNPDPNIMFLRATKSGLSLNGSDIALGDLSAKISALHSAKPSILLLNVGQDVTAQHMTDILVALRGIAGLPVSVMGAS